MAAHHGGKSGWRIFDDQRHSSIHEKDGPWPHRQCRLQQLFPGHAELRALCCREAGVIGFTRSLAREVGAYGITANVVAPGLTSTQFVLDSTSEAFLENRRAQRSKSATSNIRTMSSGPSCFLLGKFRFRHRTDDRRRWRSGVQLAERHSTSRSGKCFFRCCGSDLVAANPAMRFCVDDPSRSALRIGRQDRARNRGGKRTWSRHRRRLCRVGAHVICADIEQARVDEVVNAIRVAGGAASALRIDVSSEASVEAAFGTVVQPHVDILVNFAGVASTPARTHELDIREWHRLISINLTGTFLTTRAALPKMLKQGGSIINVASVIGLGGYFLISPRPVCTTRLPRRALSDDAAACRRVCRAEYPCQCYRAGLALRDAAWGFPPPAIDGTGARALHDRDRAYDSHEADRATVRRFSVLPFTWPGHRRPI